jgi:hypothetical protein
VHDPVADAGQIHAFQVRQQPPHQFGEARLEVIGFILLPTALADRRPVAPFCEGIGFAADALDETL